MKDLTKFIQEAFITKSNIKQVAKDNKEQSDWRIPEHSKWHSKWTKKISETQHIAERMENVFDCELEYEDTLNNDDYDPIYRHFEDGNPYDIYNITCFSDQYWGMVISQESGRIGFISEDGDVPSIVNGRIVFPRDNSYNACHTPEEWDKANIKEWLIKQCEE